MMNCRFLIGFAIMTTIGQQVLAADLCGIGLQQSPIDLIASPKTKVPNITIVLNNLNVYPNGAKLTNYGVGEFLKLSQIDS